MSRLFEISGTAWALILVAGAIFYVVTGSVGAAAIALLLEIGVVVVARQFKKSGQQSQ